MSTVLYWLLFLPLTVLVKLYKVSINLINLCKNQSKKRKSFKKNNQWYIVIAGQSYPNLVFLRINVADDKPNFKGFSI